jgi:hypothetical protein
MTNKNVASLGVQCGESWKQCSTGDSTSFGHWLLNLWVGKRKYRVISLLIPHLSAPALPQPLPEMEYNGNPESVGYKIKYGRSDGHGKTLSHTVQDRVEREYTIEDLEEWTEYRVQVQAFNAIGSGPWSQAVVGRTRESGTTAPLPLGPSKSRPCCGHFYRQLSS